MNTQFVILGRNTALLCGNAGVLLPKCMGLQHALLPPQSTRLEEGKAANASHLGANAELQGRIPHRSNDTRFRTWLKQI